MTGTQPVVELDPETQRISQEEALRWGRRNRLRNTILLIAGPILLAGAIGALAYFTRPEAMPAHERIRQVAREVQERRLRAAQQQQQVTDAGPREREAQERRQKRAP